MRVAIYVVKSIAMCAQPCGLMDVQISDESEVLSFEVRDLLSKYED